MIQTAFILFGALASLILLLLLVSALRERRGRAAGLSTAMLVLFVAVWFGTGVGLPWPAGLQVFACLLVLAAAGLLWLPLGHGGALRVDRITSRVDERDVIFAREEYQPGSERHARYYAMRPENLAVDEKLRRLPELLGPGGRYHNTNRSRHIRSIFRVIERLTREVDGKVETQQRSTEPRRMTRRLKRMVRHLGAADVGVTVLNPMYVYSHVGRGPVRWGKPIENRHRYAIAFTLEMDWHQVAAAPRPAITEESALQYLKGAQISISLARYIRSLGYPARAHIAGSNYQIMLPPVACDAGLGELGRMGYLISPRLGGRVRLGAVTTNLPLVPDRPITFGVQDFCARCRKCVNNCPAGAIPVGGKVWVRGAEKWQLNIEQCLRFWRVIGSDCGLCMRTCPYSHPRTLVHNLVRSAIRRSPFARRVAAWGDDVLYGKRVKLDEQSRDLH